MSAFTLSFFDLQEFTRIFNHTLKVILVKSELIYKKRKPIFCASNTLLFNSAAINTHPNGKHPEQLQNHSNHYHLFYFKPKAKRKQKETRLNIYPDFMTHIYIYIPTYIHTQPFRHINPLLNPHQEHLFFISTPKAPRYYIAPPCSIENAYLLETQNENYSAF